MASDGIYHRFSVKEAYVYPLVTDDTTSGLTYGNGVKVDGIQTINYTKNYAVETLPGEDTIMATEKSLESVEIEIEHARINQSALVILEGGQLDQSGVAPNDYSAYVLHGDDQADYFKLVARVSKIGKTGADLLLTFYKCSAGTIENGTGQKEFGTNSFQAQAVRTETTGVTTDTDDRIYEERERNSGIAGAIVATADSTAPTVTSTTPADAATGVSVSADILFDFDEALDLSTVNNTNFILMKSDGTLVSLLNSEITYNSTTFVVTINPGSSLSAATAYVAIATRGIKDAAGNRLAAPVVVNFTTA